MAKLLLIIILTVCLLQSVLGQWKDSVSHLIAIDTIKVNSLYKYQAFIKGKLNYRDGGFSVSRFNVNMLINEIQFINDKGDTLSLADNYVVDNVWIGEHEYYYEKGVIEVLKDFANIKLGISEKYDLKVKDQRGVYGESIGTASSANTGIFYFLDKPITINVNKNVLIAKKVYQYYFIEKSKGMILPATKNNLFKVFREHNKKALSEYLSEHTINFKKEEDLCKLLSFCQQFMSAK